MANVSTFYVPGITYIRARTPENAAKRVFGSKVCVDEIETDLFRITETNGYYGLNLLGYMVRE